MSLGAIQDSMAKTSLVQHTQAKGDDIQRGQEISQTQAQREDSRQADQVVIHTQQKDEHGIRTDEEKEKEGKKKKKQEEEEEEQQDSSEDTPKDKDGKKEGEAAPRAVMRKINIVI